MIDQRLRQETRAHHDEIEKSLRLMEADFSLGDYVSILRKWKSALSPLEEAIWSRPEWEAYSFPKEKRRKALWLDEDLQHLSESREALGTYEGLIPYDFASALGAAYVLEGSTLGGQILTKHFQKKFGLSPEKGLRYYSAYGPETGPYWKSFMETLKTWSSRNPDQDDRIILSAQMTFRGLNDCFLSK